MSTLRASLRLPRRAFTLDVDQELPLRGVTALFGQSGSGKTTLLRCIAGLERAPGGSIAFDREIWQDDSRRIFVPPHKRACGYVFQEANLFAHLSVRGNLEYGRKRQPGERRRMDFDRTVELMDIGALLERNTTNLSGGESQRVAIARALLASPRLLLLDEPLASLDASRKGEILYYIERLRDDLGLPIIYVSHAIDEIVRLSERVLVLDNGKVVAAGPVREAIGSDHGGAVIDATVADQDLAWGLARLAFSGGELYSADVDALPGERVRVRIASRDVALALSPPLDSSFLNVLRCVVTSVAGDEGARVDVHLDAGGTPLVARVTRKSASALTLSPGKPVFALIKAVAVDRPSVGYA